MESITIEVASDEVKRGSNPYSRAPYEDPRMEVGEKGGVDRSPNSEDKGPEGIEIQG